MPSTAASTTIDRSRLQRAATPPPQTAPAAGTTSIVSNVPAMSALFHCSIPTTAATYDTLSRQFYRDPKVPQQRLIPAGGAQ